MDNNLPNDIRFNTLLSKFRKSPFEALIPGNELLNQMILEWGNMNWSANDEFLSSCIRNALKYKFRPILECGSGLTTIILSVMAEKTGNIVWTLENSDFWVNKLTKVLDINNIVSVKLIHAKLKDYGDYEWYDIDSNLLPEKFGLLVCDGPPGGSKGGRIGLIYSMRFKMDSKSMIILDDAMRPTEQKMAIISRAYINSTAKISGIRKPFFKIFPYKY